MITKIEAMNLRHGQIIYHETLKNSDKTRLRARVNGKIKTWKTRPESFQLPIKHGLYDYGYLTEDNMSEWSITE